MLFRDHKKEKFIEDLELKIQNKDKRIDRLWELMEAASKKLDSCIEIDGDKKVTVTDADGLRELKDFIDMQAWSIALSAEGKEKPISQ